MDPISIALALASLGTTLYGKAQASDIAGKNIDAQKQALAFQQKNLIDALSAAQGTQRERTQMAEAPRFDQFGNLTAYDPSQGRWITVYTPQQQRIIAEGQAQQERAQARAAQAAEDYAQTRAGYLYKQPPTEDEIRAEILNLMQTARGEGDRALQNLVQRQELRQKGNLPVIFSGVNVNPAPGERLAQAMLQARQTAEKEHESRVASHASEYLPALAQFEKTANYIQPQDPTGSSIIGVQQQGQQDVLKGLDEYEKLIASIYGTGGKGVESAYQGLNTAAQTGTYAAIGGSQPNYSQLINALKPTAAQTKAAQQPGGTVGTTTGATYSGTPSAGGPTASATGGEGATIGTPGNVSPFDVGTPPVAVYGNPFTSNDIAASSGYSTPWFF
jgi:hypothetical protein